MRHLIPLLALALAGCMGTCPVPEVDASVPAGHLTSWAACQLIDRPELGCGIPCPWPEYVAPGECPAPRPGGGCAPALCNPEAVEICHDLVEGVNNCGEIRDILNSDGCVEACQ